MRTFVFGDVHGAGLELQALLEQCKIVPEVDLVYLVGDVFDRGIYGHLVWDLIKKYQMKVLRGNHEQKFIDFFMGKKKFLPLHYFWAINNLIDHGVEISEFVNFLHKTPLLVKDRNCIIVHAGILLSNPIEENLSANVYGNLPSNQPMPILKDSNWWDFYCGNYLVLYGHLSQKDGTPRIRKYSNRINSIGLDTSAVNGGSLTAYCIEEEKIYTFKSGVNYFADLQKNLKNKQLILNSKVIDWIKDFT